MLFNIRDEHKMKLEDVIFNKLQFSDKELYDSILTKLDIIEDNVLYSQSFHYSMGYSDELCGYKDPKRVVLILNIQGYICPFVYFYKDKRLMLLTEPIGKNHVIKKEVYKECIKIMLKINKETFSSVLYCSDEYKDLISLYKTKKDVIEFIFDVNALINLKGKDFKNIRHKCNKFENEYPDYRYENYEDKYHISCMDLIENWIKEKYKNKYVWDKWATFLYLRNHKELDLNTYLCFDKDKLIGFGSITKLCKNACLFFQEKTDLTYDGCSEHLFNYVLSDFGDEYKYLQDGGSFENDGLYNYKMKFRPVKLIQLWTLSDIKNKKRKKL